METVKAKHTVGDPIHVKILYADDRACLVFYGEVTAARRHQGEVWSNQILYDVTLGQAGGPDIVITNLPKGFVLAGGPEIDEEVPEHVSIVE